MKILKIESLPTKGWYDRDTLLLHSSFQLLKDVVEKEGLFTHSPSYAKSKNGKIAKELYDWWLERGKDVFENDETKDSYKNDTKQLVRLMKIRGGLWT